MKFSTLGEYFQAVDVSSRAKSLSYPSLGGDFFTYTDRGQQYWSGMFTTRPALKYMIRHLQARLRSVHAFGCAVISATADGHAGSVGRVGRRCAQVTLAADAV